MELLIEYIVLCISLLLAASEGLECMKCQEVPDIRACELQTAVCNATIEECYLDVSVNSQLLKVYSGGCRAKQVCAFVEVGKRSFSERTKRGVACSQCCTTEREDVLPCNGFLCGESIAQKNTCIMCSKTRFPSLCNKHATCQSNEVCSQYQYITGSKIYHDLGCIRKEICRTFIESVNDPPSRVLGRREVTDICFACCTGINCNRQNCAVMRDNMTMGMFT